MFTLFSSVRDFFWGEGGLGEGGGERGDLLDGLLSQGYVHI